MPRQVYLRAPQLKLAPSSRPQEGHRRVTSRSGDPERGHRAGGPNKPRPLPEMSPMSTRRPVTPQRCTVPHSPSPPHPLYIPNLCHGDSLKGGIEFQKEESLNFKIP